MKDRCDRGHVAIEWESTLPGDCPLCQVRDSWGEGYNEGFNEGHGIGYDDGYEDGYRNGVEDVEHD